MSIRLHEDVLHNVFGFVVVVELHSYVPIDVVEVAGVQPLESIDIARLRESNESVCILVFVVTGVCVTRFDKPDPRSVQSSASGIIR
jgi:hypothetical protein